MSRSFNRVLKDLEVSYHSNDFLVVVLVITLLDALMSKERCLQNVLEVIILMMIVMDCPLVMKMIKKSNYSLL